jgi:hypothetical protein
MALVVGAQAAYVRGDRYKEDLMEQTCLVVPVLPGKTDAARDFYREVEGSRVEEYHQSERRLGITREIAWLAGENVVVYIESPDFARALGEFSQSQDDFDLWFKERVLDVSGLDLNNPPEMELPELLSVYIDQDAAVRA